jgi:inner membrane protein
VRAPTAAVVAIGACAGLAPDLDTLIRSSTDPLLFLEYHRQFTHALVFVPVGALVCALLLHLWARTRLSFRQTYLACFLGYASHGLLDACTSYGTQLLWPFSDARIALSIVSVVDPAFTAPILVLIALALRRKSARNARIAAAWGLVYLTLGAAQHWRAATAGADIAANRGHTPIRLEVKPALGSLLLWKVIYEFEGRYYVDAVRTGFTPTVYSGESIAKLDLGLHFPWLTAGSRQALDVERYRNVSDDFLALDTTAPNRIIDMRYSMVPNEISGFWAIVLDPDATPDQHVGVVTTRNATFAHARRLIGMLF